jgi:RND family efflux transporter MFP subunit
VEQGIGAKVELDSATSRLQSAQASFDATINQIRNMIQEVERFKAQVDLQRKKLRDTSVHAPFAAFVKDRQVAVGQYVRPNAPLITLVKTDPIRLRLEVPERMAPWIRNGQIADVGIEAFADRKFTGKVWRIAPTVDQTKRTFVVEALIANPGGQLKPGSYARARMATDKNERIVVIPFRAVNYVLGSNKAYVVSSGQVEAREVRSATASINRWKSSTGSRRARKWLPVHSAAWIPALKSPSSAGTKAKPLSPNASHPNETRYSRPAAWHAVCLGIDARDRHCRRTKIGTSRRRSLSFRFHLH